METIILYIRHSAELIMAVGGLATAAITVYYMIRKTLKEKADEELRMAVIRFVAKENKNIKDSRIKYMSLNDTADHLCKYYTRSVKRAGLNNRYKLLAFISKTHKMVDPLIEIM